MAIKLSISIISFAIWIWAGLAQGLTDHHSQKAWLLIGLERVTGLPFYYLPSYESREQQLADIFHDGLKSFGFNMVVRYQATQNDLFTALEDPQSIAIFWIGHSRAARFAGGLIPPGVMTDAQGADITSTFADIHPNVRWLSVIGCQSKAIFDYFSQQGFYRDDPDLTIDAAESLVEPSIALTRSVVRAHLSLAYDQRKNPNQICRSPNQRYFPLTIQRKISDGGIYDEALPVAISLRGKVIATLPSSYSGVVQSTTALIPDVPQLGGASTDFRNFDLQLSADDNLKWPHAPGFDPMGQFDFAIPGTKIHWQVLRGADGVPLGHRLRVYEIDHHQVPDEKNSVVPPC